MLSCRKSYTTKQAGKNLEVNPLTAKLMQSPFTMKAARHSSPNRSGLLTHKEGVINNIHTAFIDRTQLLKMTVPSSSEYQSPKHN